MNTSGNKWLTASIKQRIDMELYIVKLVIVATCCIVLSSSAQQKKQDPRDSVWTCTRWTWTSTDVFDRQVICLERKKEDCSKRLHKELCRGNSQ